MVLVHGWGVGPAVMSGLAEELSASWPVNLLALPGYGGNHHLSIGPNIDCYAEILAASIEPESILVGWSLGGMVALALAKCCEHIKALVLLASTPCFTNKPDWSYGVDAGRIDNMIEGLHDKPETVLNEFLLLASLGDASPRETRRALAKHIDTEQINKTALHSGLSILRDTDLRSCLRQITCPVILVLAEHDRLVSGSVGAAAQHILSGLRLEIISGTGHAPFISQPRQTASVITHALTAVLDEPV